MQFSVSETYRIFNSARLKRIAIVTMAIDHGAACLIFNSLIRPHIPISRTGSLWNLYQFYLFLRAVGRTAFPIFCFLLVEGFVHTHSRLRYIIRLLLFGLISEVPFDLCLYQTFWYPGHQNVMFELAMGVGMLWAFDAVGKVRRIHPPEVRLALQFLAAVPFILLAQTFHLDYDFRGMLLILLLFLLRDDRVLQCAAGAIIVGLWEWPAVFAFLPLLLYNGQRGRQSKYFFYVFYPAQFMVFFLIGRFCLGMAIK